MVIQQYHFDHIVGNTLSIDLSLLDDKGEPVTDLVGATVELQIRNSVLSVDTLFTSDASEGVVIPTDGDVLDPTPSLLQFSIDQSKTALFLTGNETKKTFVYGCRLTYSDGFVTTVLTGRIQFIKGVVR
jgi:hypothetical protein